jgi:hypothetical protein
LAEPADMTISTLREMKRRHAPLEEQTRAMVEGLHRRFQSFEAVLVSLRHLELADGLMVRVVTDDFAARLDWLEQQVPELERSA